MKKGFVRLSRKEVIKCTVAAVSIYIATYIIIAVFNTIAV